MGYIEEVAAAANPAIFIEPEGRAIKDLLRTKYPTNHFAQTHKTGRENAALATRILDELRHVWRLAHSNDPAWRPALWTFIQDNEEIIGRHSAGYNKLVRLRIIASAGRDRANA